MYSPSKDKSSVTIYLTPSPAFYVLSQYPLSTPFLLLTPRWGLWLKIFHVPCLFYLLLENTGPPVAHYYLYGDDFQIWFRSRVEFLPSYTLPEASTSAYLISKSSTPYLFLIYIFDISYLGNGTILPVIQERKLCPPQYCSHNSHSQLGVNLSWFLQLFILSPLLHIISLQLFILSPLLHIITTITTIIPLLFGLVQWPPKLGLPDKIYCMNNIYTIICCLLEIKIEIGCSFPSLNLASLS